MTKFGENTTTEKGYYAIATKMTKYCKEIYK